MNCPKCGSVLSPNSSICNVCGMELENPDTVNPTQNIEKPEVTIENTNQNPLQTVEVTQQESPVVEPATVPEQVVIQEPTEQVQENNVVVEEVQKPQQKNDTLFYTILGVVSVLIVVTVVYLLFFANR